MKTKWNVTKLIAIGSLAVLDVVLALFGAGINAVTGIPLMGGVLNNLVENGITVLCCLIMDQFGAATILKFVLGILQIPLPIAGTPGFVPKVLILVIGGLIADVLYLALKRNRVIASLIIGGLPQIYYIFAVVQLGRLFGMPGVEETARIILSPLLVVGATVEGAIGGYLGWLIYCRIKDTAMVVRVRGE